MLTFEFLIINPDSLSLFYQCPTISKRYPDIWSISLTDHFNNFYESFLCIVWYIPYMIWKFTHFSFYLKLHFYELIFYEFLVGNHPLRSNSEKNHTPTHTDQLKLLKFIQTRQQQEQLILLMDRNERMNCTFCMGPFFVAK